FGGTLVGVAVAVRPRRLAPVIAFTRAAGVFEAHEGEPPVVRDVVDGRVGTAEVVVEIRCISPAAPALRGPVVWCGDANHQRDRYERAGAICDRCHSLSRVPLLKQYAPCRDALRSVF